MHYIYSVVTENGLLDDSEMKQKSILGLIILMSFSLLGIIAAQYLWIQQSIKIQRNKFHAAVYEALDKSVMRLEREQSAERIYNAFFPPIDLVPVARNPKDTLTDIKIVKKKNQPTQTFYYKSHADTFTTASGTRIETRLEINGATTEKEIWISSGQQGAQLKDLEKKMIQVEDSLARVFEAVHNDQEQVMNVFNQITYELNTRHTPVQERLHLDRLNAIIQEELTQNGIDAPFEYGVYDRHSQKLLNQSSAGFHYEQAMEASPMKVNLFPQNIFRGFSPYELMIYFPDLATYLYKSLGWMLSISILFTLFILITFFLTLRMIMNQKKVSEIKSDFINNMTHEFKTPIATISLASDSIMNPAVLNNPTQMKTFLRIIKEENSRMNSHVERVLQMSLIEKKDFAVVRVSQDLHELIWRAVDNMQLLVQDTNGTITTELKADLAVFKVDEMHFTNIIVNLLENALKYAKEAPEVTVSTQNNGNGMIIKVADKGIGMTREQQNKIFDKFYRASGGNIHNVKGFGLGLSYVKAVVDAHQGSISVKSKPDVGTEFTIYLPFN